MSPTVLIVDDHAGFRRLARRVLEAGGFRVIGEAADGGEAVAAVAALRPEVVLLDVVLPDSDGFSVAKHLACGPSPPGVILISSRERLDFGARLDAAAALAFLTKSEFSSAAVAALLEAK
jgi:two-component system nitrate/nitrite response regulator NarL